MRSRIGRESERTGDTGQKDLSEDRRSEPSQPTAIRSLGLLVVATLAVVFVLRAGWLACVIPPTDLLPAATQAGEAMVARAKDGNPPPPFPSLSSQVPSQGRLSAKDFAMLSAVCPTSIDSLPPELLPLLQKGKKEGGRAKSAGTDMKAKLVPPHRLTAAHSHRVSVPADRPAIKPASKITARITGVRVASRTDRSRQPLRLAQAGDPTTEPSSDKDWLVSPDVWFVPEDREKAEPQQQETHQQEPEPATAPAESVKAEQPALLPLTKPVRDWPVLPPKPLVSPKPAASFGPAREESIPTLEPAFSNPLNSQGPLRSEPDFMVEPNDALLEDALSSDAVTEEPHVEAPYDEKPTVTTPQVGPLFAAPTVDVLPIVPNEPAKREPSFRRPSEIAAPATVQPSEKLASPQPASRPALSLPVIEPIRQQPPVAPLPQVVSPSAATHLFASPAAKPLTTSSAHGAGAAAAARQAADGKSADLSHAELFSQNCYPSAKDCAKCHEKIYDEWSLSSHAYAYVSPMFHKFEQKLNDLSQGTVGTFCLRCHSPPGISMAPLVGQTRTTPIAEVSEVSRDGVGCISCHRVNERYGKVNGERRVVTGNLFDPVYGGLGGDGVAAAIADKTKYKLKTSASEKGPGQAIHNEGRFFDQLTRSEACVSCHQVAVHPGIKLEVVWEQYRASPACKKGVSCQDCHMGRVPGVPSGYNYGPIAEVAGKTVRTDRKQSNHSFYGPGYSIAHPGIFPQHQKSDRWNIDQWMLFDWRAGWGTEEFEDRIEEAEDAGQNVAAMFPPIWREVDDRYDARDIIDDNLEKLKIKRRQRELVMENGSQVDGPFFGNAPVAGQDLKFEYIVTNLNEGHNLPTASLGAQPQLWANIVLIGPDGRRVWESGYTDSYGDVCDIHSEDVQKGRAPYDSQLFNLQTMFMITGATGTDREFFLPVNLSIDQLAQLRPGTLPISVINHPPFIRMENRSIAPLGKKRAKYRVPAEVMCQPGHYRLSFRLRSRLEPMYFMRFVGATEEMQRAMTEGILDVHPMSVEFEVKAPVETARQPAMNEGWMR